MAVERDDDMKISFVRTIIAGGILTSLVCALFAVSPWGRYFSLGWVRFLVIWTTVVAFQLFLNYWKPSFFYTRQPIVAPASSARD
jgi:hypothetical protein